MIEKEILAMKRRSFLISEYLTSQLPKGSYSFIELKKTPLGEKIIVHTSRPGLIVGKKGSNIQNLTSVLKTKFRMENPQIDVAEVESPNLDPKGIGERIVSTFEKYGPKRFKSIGYRALQDIIDAGAIGAEIVISGRGVPGSRSKRWRFMAGHLKKSGNIAQNFTDKALTVAHLQSGAIGIQVKIINPNTILPDTIKFKVNKESNKEDLKPAVVLEKVEEKETVKEQKEKNEEKPAAKKQRRAKE